MALYDMKTNRDGSITVTSRRLTKQILVAGQLITLVTLDGSTWVTEQREKEEQSRLNRLEARQGAQKIRRFRDGTTEVVPPLERINKKRQWLAEKKKDFDARINPGKVGKPIPPMLEYHGGKPVKEKGKNAKYRRNLRKRVPTRLVKIAKPVHFHNCHGVNHPMREGLTKFACSCEFPKRRRYCGNTFCLYD